MVVSHQGCLKSMVCHQGGVKKGGLALKGWSHIMLVFHHGLKRMVSHQDDFSSWWS